MPSLQTDVRRIAVQVNQEKKRSAGLLEELRLNKEQNLAAVRAKSHCLVLAFQPIALLLLPPNCSSICGRRACRCGSANVAQLMPCSVHAAVLPMRCCCCPQQKKVEEEEEFITNKLMKRLEQLKREKQILATEVRFALRLHSSRLLFCCGLACPVVTSCPL